MSNDLQAYSRRRETLIAEITQELSSDQKFLAAWLTGSYGRNDADEVSDLDIKVVVDSPYDELLCARREPVSHQTTEERLALFSKFGKPALIHENNHNAPDNGTFTFVLYSGSALMVDWVLMPRANVERPFHSVLLFDRGKIPVSLPPVLEELAESRKTVAELWAYFWMMTAVVTKYIIRSDLVFVQSWLEQLHGLIREIERRMAGHTWQQTYTRGSISHLQPTREKQIESLRQLCKRMQELRPKVANFSESEPLMPLAEIETLLSLANK